MADKPKKDAKPVAEDCGCGCVTKKKWYSNGHWEGSPRGRGLPSWQTTLVRCLPIDYALLVRTETSEPRLN